MSDRDWLRHLIMVPAYLHVGAMGVAARVRHAMRRKIGDPSKRSECCGPRPEAFPKGMTVESIPQLEPILEQTTTFGHMWPWYCCRICGQEWFQDIEMYGHGGLEYVRKAT
jgi:hypothetical protein